MTSTLADNILQKFTARKGQGEKPTPHWSYDMWDKRIPLLEMFGPTIEGEGAVIGEQVFFLRVAGCDYKCRMCDSLHAVLPQEFGPNAHYLTPHQIAEALVSYTIETGSYIRKVVLTGGNPAMYDFEPFIRLIKQHDPNWEVFVETQGTFCPEWFKECAHITISPKGPGFGERFEADKYMAAVKALDSTMVSYNTKIVVFDNRDLEFASHVASLLEEWAGPEYYKVSPVYLSVGNHNTPTIVENLKKAGMNEKLDDTDIVEVCLRQYRIILEEVQQYPQLAPWRVLPQMHVLLWANKPEV